MEKHTSNTEQSKHIFVSNEIGTLRKLLIHSPDGGIGKIIPSKFNTWLYDDTVQLTRMQQEYDQYVKTLLWFLDPETIKNYKKTPGVDRENFFKPHNDAFHNSKKVIEVQRLLADILKNDNVKLRMVSAISAFEGLSRVIQEELENLDPTSLAMTFISGIITHNQGEKDEERKFIFPPVPNFVFTRDIGIVLKDHLLVSKLSMQARKRESIIMKFVTYYELLKNDPDKIIEITEESDFFLEDEEIQNLKRISIEGGDIMMISPNHLIVGCSERTTPSAVDAIIHRIFSIKDIEIEKISVVKVPAERAIMHIDTIFTQISRDAWVMFGEYSDKLKQERDSIQIDFSSQFTDTPKSFGTKVIQYRKPVDTPYCANGEGIEPVILDGLESLVRLISEEDFGVPKDQVKVIYSGGNVFPFSEREQWTDSCNVVALKEGVVIGYDRNERTSDELRNKLGFKVVKAEDLVAEFENGTLKPEDVEKTLILLPSTELSRARGGSHCMSMPLLRDAIR